MEKFNIEQQAGNVFEKGRNVIAHSVFIRHGEKEHDPDDPETGLTLNGEWDARVFGQSRG